MRRARKVLLLHGWGGKKAKHWLTWIETELKQRSFEVCFPKIPNNYNPDLNRWLKHIKRYVGECQPDIVIAHSLGALAWWHYMQRSGYRPQRLFSVAPPTFSSFPQKMDSFFPWRKLDFQGVEHTIIYALDDPNICVGELKKRALPFTISLVEKERGEHLDHFSHTLTLPELSDRI